MKVYDQLGNILAGEFFHSGRDITLELIKVGWAESADIDLETIIRICERAPTNALHTTPVSPSGRMYDFVELALPATEGIVGVNSWGRSTAEAGAESCTIPATGCNFGFLETLLFDFSVILLTPLVVSLTAQLASQLGNISQFINVWERRVMPTKCPYPRTIVHHRQRRTEP